MQTENMTWHDLSSLQREKNDEFYLLLTRTHTAEPMFHSIEYDDDSDGGDEDYKCQHRQHHHRPKNYEYISSGQSNEIDK